MPEPSVENAREIIRKYRFLGQEKVLNAYSRKSQKQKPVTRTRRKRTSVRCNHGQKSCR